MKYSIYTFVASAFMAGNILIGCNTSNTQKEANAQEKVDDAKENLKEVKKENAEDELKTANDAEWKTFRDESDVVVKANEKRIKELKANMKKTSKAVDAAYQEKIENLEKRNIAMREKMDKYDRTQNNWNKFKREFNHDMDELGQSLKDLTVDNTK